MQPAINGSEERLDAILAELQGLRADLASRVTFRVGDMSLTRNADEAEMAELREPVIPPPPPPPRGRKLSL